MDVRVKVNMNVRVKVIVKVKVINVLHTVATNAPYFGCMQMIKINSILHHRHHQ